MVAGRTDWQTPSWLFDRLHAEFDFTVDACANEENWCLERYWDVTDDGLAQDWTRERVWCNPPYGTDIWRWIRKGWEAGARGALAVMLVPVRSEMDWWCGDVIRASEIRFIHGRVHFKLDGAPHSGPGGSRPSFASAIVIFGHGPGTRVSMIRTPRVERSCRQQVLFEGFGPATENHWSIEYDPAGR